MSITPFEYPEINAHFEYATTTTSCEIFYIGKSFRLCNWNSVDFTLTYVVDYPSSTTSIFFINETTIAHTRTSLIDYSITETKIDNSTFIIFNLLKYYLDNLKVFVLLN